MSNTS